MAPAIGGHGPIICSLAATGKLRSSDSRQGVREVTFEPTAIKTQIWALVTQKETEPCRRSRSRRGKTSGAQETSHGRDAV